MKQTAPSPDIELSAIQPCIESAASDPSAEIGETVGEVAAGAANGTQASGETGWDNRFVHWWLLGICATVILLSFLMRSPGEKAVYVPVLNRPLPEICFSRRVLNVDCPGCGMTRCFINLSHGDFARAWDFNPAGVLLYGLIAFQIPFQSLQLWQIYHGRRTLRVPHWEIVFYLLAAVMIARWATKLVSYYFY